MDLILRQKAKDFLSPFARPGEKRVAIYSKCRRAFLASQPISQPTINCRPTPSRRTLCSSQRSQADPILIAFHENLLSVAKIILFNIFIAKIETIFVETIKKLSVISVCGCVSDNKGVQ